MIRHLKILPSPRFAVNSFMAMLEYQDRCSQNFSGTVLSPLNLAQRTIKKLNLHEIMVGPRATEKRLSEKYEKRRKALLDQKQYGADIVDSLEHQIMLRIAKELDLLKIPFIYPSKKSP